jgi:hypothetical protein
VPYVAKVVNNLPSHGNILGIPVVSMTSRALVKKIVQERGRSRGFDGERFTDTLDGAEERPGERTPLLYSFRSTMRLPARTTALGHFI